MLLSRSLARPAAVSALIALALTLGAAEPPGYFAIHVLDADTGRGVPLVELRTTNEIRLYTDSNGIVAFAEPGLMGQEVYFHVKSHGYEYPKDGFGYRGVRLKPVAGGQATLKIKRLNVAERLYRITGQGVYRDSTLVGAPVPTEQPVLNGQVTGQDTVMATVYRGRLFWIWGDTNRPSYPLGNFGASGATSELPGRPGGLDPSAGINHHYFVNNQGFSRPMVSPESIPGTGLKWLFGLTVLPDPSGRERLIAKYVRMKDLGTLLEQGLVVFNDEAQAFERLAQFDNQAPLYLDGHPFRAAVGGRTYLYGGFGPPYAMRAPAEWGAVQDPAAYEGYTCLAAGTRFDGERTKLDRGPDGKLVYGWKKGTPPLGTQEQERLVRAGLMRRDETWGLFRDIASGKPVRPHGGSVCWNPYRRRWVAIFTEMGGTSALGEIWYAEADTPVGPWAYARKILTHERYTFYNPAQHPFFDQDGGRRIYFEGTYTAEFSGNPELTPRYNYNQIMYRLDLADPRLTLPVPVYRVKTEGGQSVCRLREGVESQKAWDRVEEVAFYAVPPDRKHEGSVPVYSAAGRAGVELRTSPPEREKGEPLFLAAPDGKAPGVMPLYEFRAADGRRSYSTRTEPPGPDWQRGEQPVCQVWEPPSAVLTIERGAEPR
jgi:hypothetical protein